MNLIRFYLGDDARVDVGQNISMAGSVQNPKNSKQNFDVLEVWGMKHSNMRHFNRVNAQRFFTDNAVSWVRGKCYQY